MLAFGITSGVCYGVLWLETWCSHDFSYINKIKDLEELKTYLSTMHRQRPLISLHVECYHYETRYRTVYYTDSNGKTHNYLNGRIYNYLKGKMLMQIQRVGYTDSNDRIQNSMHTSSYGKIHYPK